MKIFTRFKVRVLMRGSKKAPILNIEAEEICGPLAATVYFRDYISS
jgi:hypothetical protein